MRTTATLLGELNELMRVKFLKLCPEQNKCSCGVFHIKAFECEDEGLSLIDVNYSHCRPILLLLLLEMEYQPPSPFSSRSCKNASGGAFRFKDSLSFQSGCREMQSNLLQDVPWDSLSERALGGGLGNSLFSGRLSRNFWHDVE